MNFEISDVLKQLPEQFFASLVQKVNQKLKEGRDVINLGQGNPDQPTPQHIVEEMKRAVERPENHKYSSFRGAYSFKKQPLHFMKGSTGSRLIRKRKSPCCSEARRDLLSFRNVFKPGRYHSGA